MKMKAAVYRGKNDVRVESLAIPEVGPGEVLLRVHACGVCPTDLKKIHDGMLDPPRVFGHETAGTIVDVGDGLGQWKNEDRVVAHHHVPCLDCFYCDRRLYAQCPRFKETGTTAGFVPSGGGFAEFVLVKEWVARSGLVRIPHEVSFEAASFVEPVNCCLKALRRASVQSGEVVLVSGQGAMGLLFDQLLRVEGAQAIACDPIEERLERARIYDAVIVNPLTEDPAGITKELTSGRGADVAILATDHPDALNQAVEATRPGARIILFAVTQLGKQLSVDVGNVCVLDKELSGSYSAAFDLQERSAELVFSGRLTVADLITHRMTLDEINQAIDIASRPNGRSLKVIIQNE